MMRLLVIAAALLCAVQGVYHPDVTAKEFDAKVDPSKSSILVEFYAPWCGHCKALAPEFARLGKMFAATTKVTIAQVDADKHRKLAKRFNIEGFPTMKWIQKGKTFADAEDVNERTAEGLANFINEKTGLRKKEATQPSAVLHLTPDNFDKVALDLHSTALIGFFAPWCGHCKSLKPVWEQLATLYAGEEHVTVASVDADKHRKLGERYDVSGFPTLKLFPSGGGDPEPYSGGRDLDTLVAFINEKAGTDIAADGGLVDGGGVVHELRDTLHSFVKSTSDEERLDLLSQCSKKSERLGEAAKRNFKYYERVLKKIMDKGVAYVATERKRLAGVLADGDSLKAPTRRNFMRRINVLKQFDEL